MEAYWSYELCHGKYLRQFHEEKTDVTRSTKRMEFYLGQYMDSSMNEQRAQLAKAKLPMRKFR